MIGIGAESQYNNPISYTQLKVALNALGLKPKAYKASGSDDIHVYVFFNELVDSELLHAALHEALERLDFSDKSIQVYPNEYQLPLPLQAGFAWLDDKLHVIVERNTLSRQDALTRFIHDINDNAVSSDKVFEGTSTSVVETGTLSSDRADQVCIEAPETDSSEQTADDVLPEEQVDTVEQIIALEPPVDTGIDPSEGTQLSLFLGVPQTQTFLPTNRKKKASKKNISTTGRSPPISDT